jgi:hypothetical protein
MADGKKQKRLPIKINDQVLKGVYANSLMVMHTEREFVLDFLSMFPPQGSVNARVVVRPESLKRMIRALKDNVDRYEARFGEIPTPDPESDEVPEYS